MRIFFKGAYGRILLSVLLGLVIFSGSPASALDPVKIGVILPITGKVAYDGQATVSGVKAATSYINDKGGILGGRKVELEIIDSQCQPGPAVSATKRLITQHNVKAIVGDFCSNATAAMQQVTEESNVALITPVAPSPLLLERGAKLFFRTLPTSQMYAEDFGRYANKSLKLKTIAIVAKNDEYGQQEAKIYNKLYEELGAPKVVYTGFFGSTDEDFSPQLTKIKSLKAEGIYIVAQTEQGSNMIKQIRNLGIDAQILGSGSLCNPKVFELAGKAAEGMYTFSSYDPTGKNPGNQLFLTEFPKRTGKPVANYESLGWDAMMVLLAAIDRAGTDKDGPKIAEQLRRTDFDGGRGRITFDEKGQAKIITKIFQVQKGKLIRVNN
jgi:branched-chain amino acid transport system substrate-binding protein